MALSKSKKQCVNSDFHLRLIFFEARVEKKTLLCITSGSKPQAERNVCQYHKNGRTIKELMNFIKRKNEEIEIQRQQDKEEQQIQGRKEKLKQILDL